MPLDGAILGNMAAEQMQALEDTYGDDPDVEIAGAMTIVRVVKKLSDTELKSDVRKRHNIANPLEAIGLLRLAEQQIVQNRLGGPGGSDAS